MKKFQMCGECELEYANPLNRRYHAQTIACKKCGPRLRLLKKSEDISEAVDADTIKKAADILKQGEVVSIKGVGGFHVCSSSDASAVNKVRHLLNRPNKPFALMVKDIEMLKKIAVFSDKEKEILCSPQRPIVVLEKKRKEMLSHVSELDSIGVMLPYTALHYLLFDHIDEPLVMTSCNIPGEPVSTTENMADFFLTHERDIVNRCDDSVIKVISDTLFFLRRSRGYSPLPVRLPLQAIDTLSLGAEFNNALCAAKNENAFLSQYIGDTSKFETCRFMKESAEKMILLTRLKPKVIACDLHPGYNSTHLAKELSIRHGATLMQFQHHKAHVAGAAAEHGLTDYVGIAMDGLGYGEDGKMWGGEVFNVDNGTTFSRIGHLEEHPQLGGDSAALYPKKMLFGILYGFLGEKELLDMNLFEKKESALYLNQLNSNFNTIPTTSSGRILDAVAALLGICDKRTYDGRPAILLESIATQPLKLEPVFIRKESKRILSTNELFRFLVENKNNDKSVLAATAQMYLAQGLYEIAKELSEKTGKEIVLSGGVAYNRMISEFMVKRKVLVNKEIPAGDGGICYGQAYLANLHFLKDSNNTSRIAGN
jgi:hydrogenase maturation protein HypF